MAIIHSCYGMHCPWEDSRGECRWKRGNPFPCELEEMDEEERRRTLYIMEGERREEKEDGYA